MPLESGVPPNVPIEPCLSFIIPAHNEAPTIAGVVTACVEAQAELNVDSEVIVVSDCSTDRTASIAKDLGAVVVIRNGERGSKADALRAGANESKGRFLFFVDADLVGLRGTHLAAVARPALRQEVLMSVGTFDYHRAGRIVQRVPWSTGERIIPRHLFDLNDQRLGGYNVELFINETVGRHRGGTASLRMTGVRQRSKAAKGGVVSGIRANIAMWGEISDASRELDFHSYATYAQGVVLQDPADGHLERQSLIVTTAAYLALRALASLFRTVPVK